MSVEIVMPKLSDTMEEGTILKWLKQVGETVARGEVLAEVETDKADMELEAEEEGVLQEIKVGEGQSAPVGAVIALVSEKSAQREKGVRDAPVTVGGGAARGDAAPSAGARGTAAPAREPAAGRASQQPIRGSAAPTERRAPAAETEAHEVPRSHAAASGGDGQARVKATPSARKIAEERGIDLRSVRGSGPDGRIVKEDVAPPAERSVRSEAPSAEAVRSQRAPAAPQDAVNERQELSRMRQSIARRMSESFREVPHFYVTVEIDMTEAARLKDALQSSELYATPISYTHMILKATALALRRHPRLNASYRDGAIEMRADVNIGMAVALEDGLIVPILQHVDERSLADIAVEARRLAEQAQQGRFGRDELSGGTFTVSNMGMLDIEDFAAVINPPQAAILAVGAIKERAVARDGAVAVARTMRVTLSCDHRIIDGVVAGRFLEELKRLLENPIVLVVRER